MIDIHASELEFDDDEPIEFGPEDILDPSDSFGISMPDTGWELRDYQQRCIAAVEEAWKEYNRIFIVIPTGGGKTIVFSRICASVIKRGGRVLICAHTDELLQQAADKLFESTGLESELEKADDHASLSAGVVIASIQTISRDNRLLGFPDDHFSLVIVDETHHILATNYLKVVNYFHYGEASLDPDWLPPEPGIPYKHKARILGVTATPDRGDKRNLGQFFQHCAFEYGLLEACRDGYLVRPLVKNIPLQIDLRGISISKTKEGADFNKAQVSARLTPLLKGIAKAIMEHAPNRKGVIFLPSIDSARRLAEALTECGMNAGFVSGACPDRTEKMEAFRHAPRGTFLCNAMLMTEGVDIDTIDCICMLRVTKIRSLLVQAAGRGLRPLKGLIDKMKTAAERLAAIAASAKPDMLILDFLWLADRLDLVRPVDLVVTKPEQRKLAAAAAESGATDLLAIELGASRDLLKSLEAAARANARKKARTVDPLSWALSMGDEALAVWEPESKWDELPATPNQIQFIRDAHIDVTNVKYRGHANKIIVRLISRMKLRLATPMQLNFMRTLGIPDDVTSTLTMKEAEQTIDATLAAKKARREAGKEIP